MLEIILILIACIDKHGTGVMVGILWSVLWVELHPIQYYLQSNAEESRGKEILREGNKTNFHKKVIKESLK